MPVLRHRLQLTHVQPGKRRRCFTGHFAEDAHSVLLLRKDSHITRKEKKKRMGLMII